MTLLATAMRKVAPWLVAALLLGLLTNHFLTQVADMLAQVLGTIQ